MRAGSVTIASCIGVLALLLGACFAPAYPTGIPCSELDTCPPDQFCVEGICRLEPGPGPGDVDGSIPPAPDASVTEPPDASPPDAPPVACTGPADCDDGLACTMDLCVSQICMRSPDDRACDDGVACTADRCDQVQGCVAAPDDSACNDNVDCTADRCDAVQGCSSSPNASACNDNVDCTTDRCDAVEGCLADPDDGACDDGDECTNDLCAADTGCFTEPNPSCEFGCLAALIYEDSGGNDAAAQAVTALGMTAFVTNTEAEFTAAFDAGGFEVVIIDSSGEVIPASVTDRLISWLDSGERLVFSHWDLDANATLKTALRVDTVRSLNPAPAVHAAQGTPVDFFRLLDQIPSPLVFGDFADDNGDALALTGSGFVAARFTDAASSEGAILVTRNDRVIVMGFLPWDVFVGDTDGDGDGLNDGDELYRNQIRFLCAPPQPQE